MSAGRYRKRSVVVDAVQLCWRNWGAVCELMGLPASPASGTMSMACSDPCGEREPYIELPIATLEGTMVAKHGDWIIRGVNGEFYPCKPDVFAKTYDPEETAPATEYEPLEPDASLERIALATEKIADAIGRIGANGVLDRIAKALEIDPLAGVMQLEQAIGEADPGSLPWRGAQPG